MAKEKAFRQGGWSPRTIANKSFGSNILEGRNCGGERIWISKSLPLDTAGGTRHAASAAVEDIPFTVMSPEVSEGKSHEPGCPA